LIAGEPAYHASVRLCYYYEIPIAYLCAILRQLIYLLSAFTFSVRRCISIPTAITINVAKCVLIALLSINNELQPKSHGALAHVVRCYFLPADKISLTLKGHRSQTPEIKAPIAKEMN
jgi:hypothetical protein